MDSDQPQPPSEPELQRSEADERFRLVGLIDPMPPSGDRGAAHGWRLPLFGKDGKSTSWVQDCANGVITRFVPVEIITPENITVLNGEITKAPGEEAMMAFEFVGEAAIVGSDSDVRGQLLGRLEDLDAVPFTKLATLAHLKIREGYLAALEKCEMLLARHDPSRAAIWGAEERARYRKEFGVDPSGPVFPPQPGIPKAERSMGQRMR